MKHKHRIVPGHLGGTYEPSNVVLLTIEEHAEVHRLAFEKDGRWQDEVAWKALAGQIGKEEIISQVISNTHKGKPKSEEQKLKMKLNHTRPMKGKHHSTVSKLKILLEFKVEYYVDLNHINSQRKTCENCGKTTNLGNYYRWHGSKCKHG